MLLQFVELWLVEYTKSGHEQPSVRMCATFYPWILLLVKEAVLSWLLTCSVATVNYFAIGMRAWAPPEKPGITAKPLIDLAQV